MIQRSSQLASCRAMRDVLIARECHLSYEEFTGGHEIDSWRADLPLALASVLSPAESLLD